jgi:Rps23 Pro-64 3,4-dihydroxylase Tpa1-like proline 4-hydroxylase
VWSLLFTITITILCTFTLFTVFIASSVCGSQMLRTDFRARDPFPNLVLESFLEPAFAQQLTEELKGLDYELKKNDLYEFVQSKDLNDCKLPLVSKFRQVLYSEQFRSSLQAMTGMELKDQVDMFAAVYENGHHLLPHDDQLTVY